MSKFQNILIKIFYILLCLSPCLMAVVMAGFALTSGWEWLFPGYDHLHFVIMEPFGHFIGAFINLLVLSLVGVGSYLGVTLWLDKTNHNVSKTDNGKINKLFGLIAESKVARLLELKLDGKGLKSLLIICASVMFLAFVPRIVLFVIFGGSLQPSSDCANMWQLVKGNLEPSVLGHYTFFPAYLNYAAFMKVIAAVSGYRFSAVLFVNIITNVITAGLISVLANLISKNSKVAFVSGLVYALYPSGIIYTLTATPEHQCIMFLVLMVILVILALRQEEYPWSMILMGLAGFCAALSNAFKNFIPVVLVAMVIVLILHIIGEKLPIPQIGVMVAGLVILVCCQSATSKGIEVITARVFDVKIDASDALPHFIVVGINREGEGQIHLGEMSHFYTNLREIGVPADKAREETFSLIKDDWATHADEIIPFIVKKEIWEWQDDYGAVRVFGYASSLPESTLLEYIRGPVATATQLGYYILMGACLISGVASLLNKKGYNLLFILNDMIIYGFFWLMNISEAQSRYKSLIIPFLCIMAARLIMLCKLGSKNK